MQNQSLEADVADLLQPNRKKNVELLKGVFDETCTKKGTEVTIKKVDMCDQSGSNAPIGTTHTGVLAYDLQIGHPVWFVNDNKIKDGAYPKTSRLTNLPTENGFFTTGSRSLYQICKA